MEQVPYLDWRDNDHFAPVTTDSPPAVVDVEPGHRGLFAA